MANKEGLTVALRNQLLSDLRAAEARIEELEIAIRAALSYIQNQPGSRRSARAVIWSIGSLGNGNGHGEMIIAALRGALAKRERD